MTIAHNFKLRTSNFKPQTLKMKRLIILLTILFIADFSHAQSFGKTLKDTPGIVSYTYRKSFEKDVPATLDTIKRIGYYKY